MGGIHLVSSHTYIVGHLQPEESCSLSVLSVKQKQAHTTDEIVKVLMVKVLILPSKHKWRCLYFNRNAIGKKNQVWECLQNSSLQTITNFVKPLKRDNLPETINCINQILRMIMQCLVIYTLSNITERVQSSEVKVS